MVVKLTKQSTGPEIRAYFEGVLSLAKSDEQFPVNLDDVWPLVYSRKDKAVRALKDDKLFLEGLDYIPLPQNGERADAPLAPNGKRAENGQFCGANQVTYMLSVPCLEFFIARKVRAVFEVYRKVFHKAADGELIPSLKMNEDSKTIDSLLAPLSRFHDMVMERWDRLRELSNDNASIVKFAYATDELYRNYRFYLRDLVFTEAIERVEGREAIK